jgi:hypothetical protein
MAAFSVYLSYTQSVGLLGRRFSSSQGLYLHTINAHNIEIHAFSGIRTHDSSVRANEDGSVSDSAALLTDLSFPMVPMQCASPERSMRPASDQFHDVRVQVTPRSTKA